MHTLRKILLIITFLFYQFAALASVNNISEEDGSPSLFPWKLKVTNGTLTDNGDGSASLVTGGGGGSGDITDVGDCTTGACFNGVGTGTLITMPDNGIIGLSNSTGRMEFDDQATDEVNILSANVGIGSTSPAHLLTLNRTAGTGDVIMQLNRGGSAEMLFGISDATDAIIIGSTAGDGVLRVQADDLLISTDSGTSPAVIVKSTGNVGIGTASPSSLMTLTTTTPIQTTHQMLTLYSSDAVAIDKGGSIGFGGLYTGSTIGSWAQIRGLKETATDGQLGSYLQFNTRQSGGTWNVDALRITSTSTVGIGTSTPGKELEVNHPTGAVQRWTYNDADGAATNKMDLDISSSGDATFAPSGGDLNVTGNIIPTGSVVQRTNTVASSATPSINTDTTDIFTITALAVAITSMTSNLTGTPTNGQKLIIRILDNGTARAITWGASYASRGATLPTTTVLSKYTYVGLIYNSTAAVWDCVAVSTEA